MDKKEKNYINKRLTTTHLKNVLLNLFLFKSLAFISYFVHTKQMVLGGSDVFLPDVTQRSFPAL